jgi:hypothetical protein
MINSHNKIYIAHHTNFLMIRYKMKSDLIRGVKLTDSEDETSEFSSGSLEAINSDDFPAR